jgi:tripartite-type tricarboxylate transporter receptor subunit TctC
MKGFDAFAWQGIVAPARTPGDIVTLLYRTVDETLRQRDIARKLEEGGVELFGAAPGQFAGFVSNESQRWARVISDAGIRLE